MSFDNANMPEDDEPYPGEVTQTTMVFAPKVQRRHIIKIQDFSDRVRNHVSWHWKRIVVYDKFNINIGNNQSVTMIIKSKSVTVARDSKRAIEVQVFAETLGWPPIYKATCSIYLTCVDAPRQFLLVDGIAQSPGNLLFNSDCITIETIEAEPEKYLPNGTLTVVCELEFQETRLNQD